MAEKLFFDFPTQVDPIKFVEFGGVRITPGILVFNNAFEGKLFTYIIDFQNVSNHPVTLWISKPSSTAVKVQYMSGNNYFCPGLKVFCRVVYKFTKHMALPQIVLPIYVNEKRFDYKMYITLSKAEIIVEPDVLDFGCVDANCTAMVRIFQIRNLGSQNTRFAVDLGRNELDLVVEPLKGTVEAGRSTSISVEIMGSREYEFDAEFWIKCDPPKRLRVIGNFIRPRLFTHHPDTCTDFTIIDFPVTHFGCKSVKTLLIENFSSSPCMFCATALVNNQEILFAKARETEKRFKYFSMKPHESRLLPHQRMILTFTFNPFIEENTGSKEYFIGFIHLSKVNFRDISYQQHEDYQISTEISTTASSTAASVMSIAEDTYYPAEMSEGEVDQKAPFSHNLRICLHGEAHKPLLHMVPEIIMSDNLILKEVYIYSIYVQNPSSVLPLLIKYKKTTFIEIKPQVVFLKPEASIELYVTFKMVNLGVLECKITFELYGKNNGCQKDEDTFLGYHEIPCKLNGVLGNQTKINLMPKFNMGITPMVTNEVGYLTQDVTFNTDVTMPQMATACLNTTELKQRGSYLIAFPNDRPKSLRPWTNKVGCKTVFANLPRGVSEDEYMLSEQAKNNKIQQKQYYQNFIRSLHRPSNKRLFKTTSYQTTNLKLKMLKDIPKADFTELKTKLPEKVLTSITPLTPSQLKAIEVKPAWIFLGRVAPHTGIVETFTVSNKNDFPVIAKLLPLKNGITVIDSRHYIQANKSIEAVFVYNATSVGRYTVPVEIIINTSHVFEINVVAYVVSKIVQCDVQEWVIYSNDRSTEFLELRNPLNSHVSFTWEVNSPCFIIEPSEGCIPPKRTILCHAQYKQDARQSDFAEILLVSESGYTENIKVVYKKQLVEVAADKKQLIVEDIPLNTPIHRYITLRNFSFEPASFTVITPKPIYGVELLPIDGVIPARGDQIIIVKLVFNVIISFSCILSINVERCGAIDIEFKGSVIYPRISIEPSYITMQKIVPYAEDQACFKIKNLCILPVNIRCAIENFPEFMIYESKNCGSLQSQEGITLNSGESRNFLLHFAPTEAAVCGLFLPLIVNNILGPPQLNARQSIYPQFFISEELTKYQHITYVKQLELPKTLPLCKITTTVSKPILKFSNLNLNFVYHHIRNYTSQTSYSFEVTNVSSCKAEICIRLDDLKEPFQFFYKSGATVEKLEHAYYICLESNKTSEFEGKFTPSDFHFGTYNIKLPIFVHGFYDGCAFNSVRLHGLYPKAIINPVGGNNIFLEPTGLKYVSKIMIKLKIAYHYGDCFIMTDVNHKYISFEFIEGRKLKLGSYKTGVRIIVSPSKVKSFDGKIQFSCSCGAMCTIKLYGSFENCIPTAHSCFHWYGHPNFAENSLTDSNQSEARERSGSLDLGKESMVSVVSRNNNKTIYVTNETIYPLFPLDDDNSDYALYMRYVRTVAENWLYTQGFNRSKSYSIPDGLAAYPQEIALKTEGRIQKNELMPVLVKLLFNLAGKEVKKHVFVSPPAKDTEKNRMLYMFTSYKNCVEFLRGHEAFIPHVFAENLLTYQHYELYLQHLKISEQGHTAKNYTEFRQLSTQSWLDVVLQIYKVYMLNRVEMELNIGSTENKDKLGDRESSTSCSTKMDSCIHLPTITKSSGFILKPVYSKLFLNAVEKLNDDMKYYTKSESILLYWLEFHFERNRCSLWNPERYGQVVYKLTKRKIMFFDNDLKDGLVIGSVMGSYCPYLKKHLKGMYTSPTKTEQIKHNAGKIVQAWHWLKLSFNISPETIIKGNMVEMLMMVNYMYLVFPGLYPRETVTLKCCFTEVTEHEISVDNESEFAIMYYVLFFGEDSKYFQTANQSLLVPSKQSVALKIKFLAKSMVKVKAVLVLSGEYPGKKYAKCLAVNLIGIPDITVANCELSIVKNLYELKVTNIEIESPYKVAATYDALITADPFADNVVFSRWIPQVEFNLPSRFYPRQNIYEFDSDGKCSMQVNVCCGSPYPQSYWIYFLNPEVGDFALKITITGKQSKKNNETLEVDLPRGFTTSKCICKPDSKSFLKYCPRALKVNIPRKNNILWDSIKNMLMACVSEDNLRFFKKYLAIPTGRRVLRAVSENNPISSSEMDYVYQKSAVFKVKYGKKANIKSDKTLVIDDMTSNGSVPLILHFEEGKTLQKLFIKLEEATGKETRYYNLMFESNEFSPPNEEENE